MAARFSTPMLRHPSVYSLPASMLAEVRVIPYRIWFSCAHCRTLRVGEDTRGRLYPCGPEKRVWLQFQHCRTDKQVARPVTSTKVGRGLLPPPSQPCRACAHQHLCSSGHLQGRSQWRLTLDTTPLIILIRAKIQSRMPGKNKKKIKNGLVAATVPGLNYSKVFFLYISYINPCSEWCLVRLSPLVLRRQGIL